MQPQGKNDDSLDEKKDKAIDRPRRCNLCNMKETVHLPVYITVVLFAMSTWISITSVFVEMPLLVDFLPEAWSLPSYLVIIIQCSNIGPLIYTIVRKLKSGNGKKRSVPLTIPWRRDVEVISIFVIMTVCVLSTMMLSLVWMVTVPVGDSLHSIPLFSLVFICAFVSCTSSVVFLPYMARFKTSYISAFYIGNGLCGMVPGLLSLAQGVGQEPDCIFRNDTVSNGTDVSNGTANTFEVRYKQPLFSVTVFFGIITFIVILCLAAFYFLNFHSVCRKEMVVSHEVRKSPEEVTHVDANPTAAPVVDETPMIQNFSKTTESSDEKIEREVHSLIGNSNESEEAKSFLKRHGEFILLLTYMGILSGFINSLMPASLPYTCLPYGRITYTLSVRLYSVAVPIASLSTLFLPEASFTLIHLLLLIACSIAVFLLILASYSPNLVFADLLTGQIVIVITSIIMMSSFSYVRVSIASMLRRDGGRKSLLWCGGVTQFGSLCGAIVAFILIRVFQSRHPCE